MPQLTDWPYPSESKARFMHNGFKQVYREKKNPRVPNSFIPALAEQTLASRRDEGQRAKTV